MKILGFGRRCFHKRLQCFKNVPILTNSTMKNLIQYRYSFEVLFFEFLKTKDIPTLETNLKKLETTILEQVEHKENESLWFRFFEGNNLVNTIDSLIQDIISVKNRTYAIENMGNCISLNPEFELQIYVS